MNRIDVTIVVISWNTRQMTHDCLRSVYDNLGDLPAEVILVDNNSADGSAEMVAADFPQAILIRNADNRGFAAANNQGFVIARGRHILLLNSDTLIHGDVIQRSVAYLDQHPTVGAMGCRVLNTDGSVQLTCGQFPTLFNLFLQATALKKLAWPRFFGRQEMSHWARDSERPVDTITGCYLMLRREVMDDVGMLDEDFFFFGEETDWCRRMRDAGWGVMFAPVGQITHHGSVSARKHNHKRDVMLSNAIVRLHRKHGGPVAAALAWAIVFSFNASRALVWRMVATLGKVDGAKERAEHFRKVAADSMDG
jgi:hypothetical protein